MRRKIITVTLAALLLYALSYVYFRQTHLEWWESENKTYLVIGAYEWRFYYIYRPLIIIDCSITGIGLGQRG